MDGLVSFLYLLATALFIFGLKNLTKVRTARRGNGFASLAMLLAVVATLLDIGIVDYRWIVIGLVIGSVIGVVAATRVKMTSMPEMVALLNGCGGAASALVALSAIWLYVIEPLAIGTISGIMGGVSATTVALSIFIGSLTLSGSVVAFMKLAGSMRGDPILIPARHAANAALLVLCIVAGIWLIQWTSAAGMIGSLAVLLTLAAALLGVLLVIPIGGADMPVVISLLNSYSGLAAAATGFVIANEMLIIAGALVGASGLILTQIMCKAMNRSLANVIFGGFGAIADEGGAPADQDYGPVRSGGAEEAAILLDGAEKVMIVPGYGLAVAQAQHTTRELAEMLEARGAEVIYAIHPVAGRMPGHMNVLLAEADVPYEQLVEMERANGEFIDTDVVLVLGANDVVNPAAEKEKGSPIYGMPILQVSAARSVIVVKRSLSPGFAGIKNALFEDPKTMMVFMDAKQALQEMISELKQAS
ncbi:MAG: NAD(P)(+) transhydrogenase (Re/Si-specific) subunit beta [Acidobacteria bacterium]|nr:NAD(P)(+) transhydrogenase (Re/Si-specific) subunit beta [Acidobacteriota bacterium]